MTWNKSLLKEARLSLLHCVEMMRTLGMGVVGFKEKV